MSASSGGFPSPEQPASPAGSFRIYQVTLTKLNGNLLSDTRTYSGTLEVLQSAARSTLRHNLLSGWWGLPRAGRNATGLAIERKGDEADPGTRGPRSSRRA